MSVPKCTSWLGHKFEARYSLYEPGHVEWDGQTVDITPEFITATAARRIYHHDICVRCGFVVEHKTDKSSS